MALVTSVAPGWVALPLWLALCVSLAPAAAGQSTPPGESPSQGLYLAPGEPAPAEGVFFSGEVLIRLVEALRDRAAFHGQVAALKAQVEALEVALSSAQAESQAKQEALDALRLAIAKAEWIDQNHARIAEQFERILKAQGDYIGRLEHRIHSLERQQLFLSILGPLGLLFGLFLR